MFRVKSVLLSQFAFFRSVRIPFEGENTLIGGPNGAGKTTLLDAIRLALGSERLSHNKNVRKEYLRPENHYHVAGLVAVNRVNGKPGLFHKIGKGAKVPLVTLARVWIPKGDGYESRYVILDGEPDVDDIIQAAEGKDAYTPEKYRETLALLGITPDSLEHVIIRQGRVHDIANSNGRELYQAVLASAGATGTKENYASARKAAQQEVEKLAERRQDHATSRAHLMEKAALREKRRTYDQKTQEILAKRDEKEARKAFDIMRDLKAHRDRIAQAEETEGPLSVEVEEKRAAVAELRRRSDELKNPADRDDRARIEKELDEAQAAYQTAAATKEDIRRAEGRLRKSPEANTAAAELALQDARETWAKARGEQHSQENAIKALEDEAQRLQTGQPYPAEVTATLQALREAKIAYRLFADHVEVQKNAQAGLEHALGNLRFLLHVPKEHHPKALELARQHAYPGPITTHEGVPLGKGPLRSSEPLPDWVQSYAVDAGLVQDRHGAWVAEADNLVLGKDAARQAIAQNAKRHQDAVRELAKRAATANSLETRMRKAEGEWQACQQRDEDKALVATKADVEAKASHNLSRLVDLRSRLSELGDAAKLAQEALRVGKKLEAEQRALRSMEDRLRGVQEALGGSQKRIKELEPQLKTQLDLVGPEWRRSLDAGSPDPATQASLDARIKDLEHDIHVLGDVPEPSIHEEVKRLEEAVERYGRMLADQMRRHDEAQAKLTEARSSYAKFCTKIVDDYCKRVKEWAGQFGVACTYTATPLSEQTGDDGIDQAQLAISFGFGGKPPAPSNGGSFSGGEMMINGIILRLAMTRPKEDSFFIVDQPYDNLDFANVTLVAKHLKQTSLHVIIVVPSSDSPAAYHGVVRAIKLHRSQGQDWAPVPEVMGVRTT